MRLPKTHIACIFVSMMKTSNPHPGAPALRKAIAKAGGITKLADMLGEGTKSQTIANWMTRGVPLDRCLHIEKVTGIRCEDLNPEIDWKTMREVLCAPDRAPYEASDDAQPPVGGTSGMEKMAKSAT